MGGRGEECGVGGEGLGEGAGGVGARVKGGAVMLLRSPLRVAMEERKDFMVEWLLAWGGSDMVRMAVVGAGEERGGEGAKVGRKS